MLTHGAIEEDSEGQKLPVAGQRALEVLLEEWLPLWQREDRSSEPDPMQWEVPEQSLPH